MDEKEKAAARCRAARHDLDEAWKRGEFAELPFAYGTLATLCQAVAALSATEAASGDRLPEEPRDEQQPGKNRSAPHTDGRLRLVPLTIVAPYPAPDTHAWQFVRQDGMPCGDLTQAQYEAVVAVAMENALRYPPPPLAGAEEDTLVARIADVMVRELPITMRGVDDADRVRRVAAKALEMASGGSVDAAR